MSHDPDLHLDAEPRAIPALSGDPIHHRNYDVQVVRESPDRMRIRGTVTDRKPPGTYFEGEDRPLVVHHMIVDLVIDFPSMEIVDAIVHLETHPHSICRRIEAHYDELIGLSIARGFSRRVRELFGGPRGCTHTTALLLAMAPAAIQATWSMRPAGSEPVAPPQRMPMTRDELRERFVFNLNTCHVWDEDSDFVSELAVGGDSEVPLWAERRLLELGRDPQEWFNR